MEYQSGFHTGLYVGGGGDNEWLYGISFRVMVFITYYFAYN